jgi:hypothetical protein
MPTRNTLYNTLCANPLTNAERQALEGLERIAVPAPTASLTLRERQLLRAFEAAIRRFGNPSVREIALCAGETWYASNVHKYLVKLAAKGWVALPPYRYRIRGIRLLHNPPEEVAV